MKKVMKLSYDNPAPDDDKRGWRYDSAKNMGWESQSLPIGNAYFGAKLFGLTERERIQLSEKTLSTNGTTRNSGNTSFAECYIHFNHSFNEVENYSRELSLDESIARVGYTYGGVKYTREYFASYPDKVAVIKLEASERGMLSFTLEPKISYFSFEGRSGDVTGDADNKARVGTLTLAGHLPGGNVDDATAGYGRGTVGYEMDFEAQFRVIAEGGEISAMSGEGCLDKELDEYSNATLTVNGADRAYIIISLGTNYELCEQIFSEKDNSKKLAGLPHPHERITDIIDAASNKSYSELKRRHTEDYQKLFSRVKLDLGGAVESVTTDELIARYKQGEDRIYLEELFFQFGRYLLISSSREGCLPPNLTGVWNRYHTAICLNGYWSNVNIQMNFWSAFNTNLAECFKSYEDFYKAYLPANSNSAAEVLVNNGRVSSMDEIEGELWSIATGMTPFSAHSAYGGRDGWGNTSYMAESFWDCYDYTRDEKKLADVVFPALLNSANFLTYLMEYDSESGLYLTNNSGSPEQSTTAPYIEYLSKNPSYVPRSSTYDQGLAYSNYKHVIDALEIIPESSLSPANKKTLGRIREQINKLDPIPVGCSGQVKEFREENFYGEIGEPEHRHISHLGALHPSSVINNVDSPAWLDAARVTLNGRGNNQGWGWSYAVRALGWARVGGAEQAYDSIRGEILATLGDNLCTLCYGMFQVDGNLGTPSAICEMLLQSHEGYIAPLAALPSKWKSGSYSGLVARGAFEIGAVWENGFAKKITVTSKKGGICRLKYFNADKSELKDSLGNDLPYSSENPDVISFMTTAGQSYTLVPKGSCDIAAAPEELKFSRSDGKVKLSWTSAKNAACYNVYKAEGSSPEYETLARCVAETEYCVDECRTPCTYAVCAVSKDGRESIRKTVRVL